MFTGLIAETAAIVACAENSLSIEAASCADEALGASVAINGVCLTIAARDAHVIRFDLLPDTLLKSNLGACSVGDIVNVEPALRLGQPLGGHWVQGHVDAVGIVQSVTELADALDIELAIPDEILRLCVAQGSICVNGVSLTIMSLLSTGVRLSLIPETRIRTNLGALRVGDKVNLEADILARYVERLATFRSA